MVPEAKKVEAIQTFKALAPELAGVGWALDLPGVDWVRLGEERGPKKQRGCLVEPSWGCTCSLGAAACATLSSAPAPGNTHVSLPHSVASTARRAPEARLVG